MRTRGSLSHRFRQRSLPTTGSLPTPGRPPRLGNLHAVGDADSMCAATATAPSEPPGGVLGAELGDGEAALYWDHGNPDSPPGLVVIVGDTVGHPRDGDPGIVSRQ